MAEQDQNNFDQQAAKRIRLSLQNDDEIDSFNPQDKQRYILRLKFPSSMHTLVDRLEAKNLLNGLDHDSQLTACFPFILSIRGALLHPSEKKKTEGKITEYTKDNKPEM